MTAATAKLSDDLWRRAKGACADHRTSLQALLVEGLELRLDQLEAETKEATGGA